MTSQFQAAVLIEPNQPLEIMNIEVPILKYGQVLIKIRFSTICASQRFEVMGLRGHDKFLPHLLGHEGYGIVMDTGPGVSRFKEGDEVILTWVKQGGLESSPIHYLNASGKRVNSGKVSSFSEFAVISENRLFHAPNISQKHLLPLLGCAALTGVGMVSQSPCVSGRALVIGAGGVGIFSTLKLLSDGASEVHIIERNVSQVELLQRMSPKIRCYDSALDPKLNLEINENGLFNEVYEATGDAILLQEALRLTSLPGKIMFATHPEEGKTITLNPFDLIRGLEIRGTWGGGCTDSRERDKVTDFFVNIIDKLEILVSNPHSLAEVNSLLRNRNPNAIRDLLEMP